MRVRTFLLIFIFFLALFSVPTWMLLDRSPAVETTMTTDPPVVSPGAILRIISMVRVLRRNCRARVYPQLRIPGIPIINLPSQYSPSHNEPGMYGPYQYSLVIPADAPRGVVGVFRRNTDRGCGSLQYYLWPMREVHEVQFMIE